jgi:phenylacetate-CoA ligase
MVYRSIYRILFTLKDMIDQTGIVAHLNELKREQWLPLEAIVELQQKRLRLLLKIAGDHSPYYRDLFKQRGIEIGDDFTLGQLKSLPLLRRENVQDHVDRILCDNAVHVTQNASGGSTGNPVTFYQNQGYVNYGRALHLLFLSWIDVAPGDKVVFFWGTDRDTRDLSWKERLANRIDRVRFLDSFSMTDEKIDLFLKQVNRFKPRYVYGYASSLYHVARRINAWKPLNFRPVAVRSSAEMLYPFQRTEIEKAFGAPVFDFYGSREVNNLAAECPIHKGLHVFASARIVEIVDDNGHPVPDGTPGNIAVTDLTNMAFPFVRYLNGDIASLTSVPCSCGRNLPRIDKLYGRSSDMIVVNGQYVHGEFFTHLFYGRPGVRQFQLEQNAPDQLTLLVVSDDSTIDLADVEKAIHAKLGDQVRLKVARVDNIPATSTGKYRFTVSRLRETPKDSAEQPGRINNQQGAP